MQVNVEELDMVAGSAGIQSMPTFQVYKNGKQYDELMGTNIEKLISLLKKYNC